MLDYQELMVLKNVVIFLAGVLLGAGAVFCCYRKRIFQYHEEELPGDMVALLFHDEDKEPLTVLDKKNKYRHIFSIGQLTAQKRFKASNHIVIRRGGALSLLFYAIVALVILGYIALAIRLIAVIE